MRVLVTGATGFVGVHLIRRLIAEGYEVTCLIRDRNKAESVLKQCKVKLIVGDVTKPETLKGIEQGVEIVVHLAAMGHVSAVTKEAYESFVAVNEKGTQNLIEQFKSSSCLKKFIHFSSTAAMGPVGVPIINEKSRPNPITPYQKSKYRSEQISIKAYEDYLFPSIVFRPCMIYGSGGYGEFYKFCKLMKKGIFPKVGRGQNLTPLVHVNDVVTATLLAIQKGNVGEIYIIASEKSLSMDALHTYIMQAMEYKAPYIYVPSYIALLGAVILEKTSVLLKKEPIVSYRNIKSTITDRTFDISKAKNELGYKQQMPFEQGIAETVNWYKMQMKL